MNKKEISVRIKVKFLKFVPSQILSRYSYKKIKKKIQLTCLDYFLALKLLILLHLQKLLMKPVFMWDNQPVGQTSSNDISDNFYTI